METRPTEHAAAPAAADDKTQPSAGDGNGGSQPSPLDWGLVLEVIGLSAALAAWVAVVGGGRVWARLEAADVPALPTLAGLGQEWFVAEGLQTLLLPILLGGLVALVAYYSAPLERKERTEESDSTASRPAATEPRLSPVARSPHTWSRRASRPRPPKAARRRAPDGGVLPVPHTWARRKRAPEAPSPLRRRDQVRRSAVATSMGIRNRLRRLRQVTAVKREFERDPEYVAVLAIAVPALLLIVTVLIADVSVWLLVGFAAAAVALAWWGLRNDWPAEKLAAVPLAVLLLGVLVALAVAVKPWWLVAMAAITLVAGWITIGALVEKRAGRFALTLFIAIAAWSGAVGLAKERGAWEAELAHAVVYLKEADSVGGYYLGRSSDRVYVAQDPSELGEGEDADRRVVVLESDDVDRVVITNDREVPEDGGDQPPDDGADPLTEDDEPTDGEGEPRDDETEPPSESPVPPTDLPPDVAVKAKRGEIGDQVIQFQVLALTRQGRFLELDARVINRSSKPLHIGSAFGAGDDPSLDGLELFDPRNARTYETARRDDGSCLCPENLDDVELQPNEALRMSTAFELSPPAGTEVDLMVPSVGWIRGVEVT